MRKGTSISFLFLLTIAMVALFGASEVIAQIDVPPLSCTTTEFGYPDWTIKADPDPVTGEWPIEVGPCEDADQPGVVSQQCKEYRYVLEGEKSDHLILLVSQDQPIFFTDPPMVLESAPCEGEGNTDAGYLDCHDITLLFNPDSNGHLFSYTIGGPSSPVSKTVVVRHGNRRVGACRIAGAGTFLVDPNQAIAQTEITQAGPCTIELTKNLLGQIIGIRPTGSTDPTKSCTITKNGEPISSAFLCQEDENGDPECLPGRSALKFLAGEGASGENSCYNFFSYGRWYQVCY